MVHARRVQVQPVDIDDIHICLEAGAQQSAIEHAHGFGRFARHVLDSPLERHVAAAQPLRQHEGGVGGVADYSAVRAAVAQAEDDAGVAQHLRCACHGRVRNDRRRVDDGVAVLLEQGVDGLRSRAGQRDSSACVPPARVLDLGISNS
jgi:hypothetical protein